MSDWVKKIANSVLKTGNTGLKIQDVKDGSRKEGSQETKEDTENKENSENEATKGQIFGQKSG